MRALALLLLLSGTAALVAQEPKRPADKKDAKDAKPDKKEPVPGRKLKKIEGFTFYLSDEAAAKAEASEHERPPLEVLAYECKLLTQMLSPKAVDLLRRLTVFVDWDETVSLSNGRSGKALASYYSHTPAQIVKDGKHPLQAKGVTVHSLRQLTDQRQPKNDARVPCLLLHEFAHAVHDQLFGYDHAGIRAMYEQAMERRLYDKEFYAATNHKEFFAETTCAFFDRLNHYPHTRDDLKRHDPVTHKTLETVWAGAVPRAKTALLPVAHSEKAGLDLDLAKDVKFGPAVLGAPPAAGALAGKVVVVGYWGAEFSNVLPRLERLTDELGAYGLVAIGACPYALDPEVIKARAEERGATIAVTRSAFVRDDTGKGFKNEPGGRALVFDPAGKCVYRSSAYEVDAAARAAVGKLLLAEALGEGEPPAAFKAAAAALEGGAGPVAAYAKVGPLTASPDPEVKEKAKKLADALLAPGTKALAAAQAGAKGDPVASFVAAERVAARFKGTPLEAKAKALVSGLRTDKAVAAELKARGLAAQVEQIATKLRGQEGAFEPNATAFQTKNRAALEQMKGLLEQLRKQHPAARATAEAEKAAREFGVP